LVGSSGSHGEPGTGDLDLEPVHLQDGVKQLQGEVRDLAGKIVAGF
jgi:hypothetical protein